MKKVNINRRYIIEEVENKIIFFDTEKSVLITLNGTASFMFKEMRKGKTKEEIAKKIIKTYDITEENALKDCSRFLNDLTRKKVLI